VPGNASAEHFQAPDPLSKDQRRQQTMISLQRGAGELVTKCALADGRMHIACFPILNSIWSAEDLRTQ